jgi:hypothetical protein
MTSLKSLGLPLVLKADESWGGRGVAIAASREDAFRAYFKLSAPPSVLRTAKRFAVNGDATPIRACLRRRRPSVSAQRFVPGQPANAAVACWQGKVLAAVFVEVICSNGATGPATVVRVISHPGMFLAVERMVARLGLSGLCGFDFVLSAEDGTAQLVELNPRATPTCHLIAADGKNVLTELCGALLGAHVTSREVPCGEPIALFPQEMIRDPNSQYLKAAVHDIPWRSPELVQLAEARRHRWAGLTLVGRLQWS